VFPYQKGDVILVEIRTREKQFLICEQTREREASLAEEDIDCWHVLGGREFLVGNGVI
jgi:hypothetical protein